jgi:hypothetical protein
MAPVVYWRFLGKIGSNIGCSQSLAGRVAAVVAIGGLVMGAAVQPAWAAIVRLSSSYTQAQVESLGAGDIVALPDGARYLIREVLGQGNSARVFELESGHALRIALVSQHDASNPLEHMHSMESFLQGVERLVQAGVPTVDVVASGPGYAVTSREQILFSYGQFLRDNPMVGDNPIWQEFAEFAIKLGPFMQIGDQHADNIVYTSRGWLVIDTNDMFIQAGYIDDGTVFMKSAAEYSADQARKHIGMSILVPPEKLSLPKDRQFSRKIDDGIRAAREQMGLRKKPNCIQLLMSIFRGELDDFNGPMYK